MNRMFKDFFIQHLHFFLLGIILSFSLIPILNANNTQSENDKNVEVEENEVINNYPVNQKGLKAFIDPDTGELIPPPEEKTELTQPNNSIIDGSPQGEQEELVEIIHPDGSATIVMPESFQHSNKVKIDESGNKYTECVRDYERK